MSKVRNALILISLCFFVGKLLGQNDQVQQLERELIPLSGEPRFHKMIQISEALLQMGLYEKAADQAETAHDFAKKINCQKCRAIALHHEGKALARAEKKGIFGKNKAAPKFQLSNKILRENAVNDLPLLIQNLEELKNIAQKSGKTDDLAKIDRELTAAHGGKMDASHSPTTPYTKNELREELTKLEAEKQALDQKLQQQLAAQANFAKKSTELQKQSAQLIEQLAEKEAAINQMTEEQMKAELMLMQQRQMLDSLSFRASMDSLMLSNQNLQLNEARTSRNLSLAIAAALLLLFGGSFYSFLKSRQYNRQIQAEQKRSEELLLNILPALVAKELKKQGYTNPQSYDSVAVLFADFVGFSKIAEMLSPEQLVKELDTAFKAFDTIIQKHALEKIKTIGDCYMCASGLNSTDNRHVLRMVEAAKEMQDWLKNWNDERTRSGQPRFDARIGIHAGPVVAGVVGSKKFAFDIWGDTVNIAARVEQAGEGGKINISGVTYELIKDMVECQYRGAIEAKNKGKIDMYFIK